MHQHDWDPMSSFSLSPCTGHRLQITSSSRHWYAAPSYLHLHLWVSPCHLKPQNHFTERSYSAFLGEWSSPTHSKCRISDNIQKTDENPSLSWEYNHIVLTKNPQIFLISFPENLLCTILIEFWSVLHAIFVLIWLLLMIYWNLGTNYLNNVFG